MKHDSVHIRDKLGLLDYHKRLGRKATDYIISDRNRPSR